MDIHGGLPDTCPGWRGRLWRFRSGLCPLCSCIKDASLRHRSPALATPFPGGARRRVDAGDFFIASNPEERAAIDARRFSRVAPGAAGRNTGNDQAPQLRARNGSPYSHPRHSSGSLLSQGANSTECVRVGSAGAEGSLRAPLGSRSALSRRYSYSDKYKEAY